MTIGDELKKIRKSTPAVDCPTCESPMKMSQEKMAASLGVSRSYLTMIELGTVEPSVEFIKRVKYLVKVFGQLEKIIESYE